jgi:hypothetical protein
MKVAALELSAASYRPHALHAEERTWIEKNCYVDIWIELLSALGCEPLAMAPFVAAIDFTDDQWTFWKPPHDELRELYGVDVQELYVYRPLLEHALVHLPRGRLISTEADAWWLPDTQGTDYRRQHTKTTIVLNAVDVTEQRLGYFHNAGYHELVGEDFARTFRLDEPPDPAFLPLFAEVARTDGVVRRPRAELVERSRALWRRHLARRANDPVARFSAKMAADLSAISERGLGHYHAWAFGTIRQLGAAAEMAALSLRWLDDGGLTDAAAAFDSVSSGCKTLILKAARAVNARRPLDAAALFAELSAAWERGLDATSARLTA